MLEKSQQSFLKPTRLDGHFDTYFDLQKIWKKSQQPFSEPTHQGEHFDI